MSQSQSQIGAAARGRPVAAADRAPHPFHYNGPVRSSYNEARLTPENSPRQTTLRSRVEIEPAATAFPYRDYWGARGHRLRPAQPALGAGGHGDVDRRGRPDLAGARPGRLERAGRAARCATSSASCWCRRRCTAMDDDVVTEARRRGRRRPAARGGRAGLPVRPRPDGVPVRLDQREDQRDAGLDQGQGRLPGHLARAPSALLRALGLPARYVSGYLHPKADAAIGEPVTGESHAWVEWWDGGWHGFDPTNAVEIGNRHVTLGRGRDYGDVPPFKGLFSGPNSEGHTVTVEVTRLA